MRAAWPITGRGPHLPPAVHRVPDLARPSLRDIYAEEFSYVWHSLRRLGTHAADLEDAVHDVFVVVHRRLGDYDPGRPLRPWLFGIVYRVASERRRRAGTPAVSGDGLLAAPDGGPTAEALVAAAQARAVVQRALQALPLDQRAVMIMHDLEGHSAPEVAEALGVPLNTVYSRLRLAREKFAATVRAAGASG